jgi:hypothetical protein
LKGFLFNYPADKLFFHLQTQFSLRNINCMGSAQTNIVFCKK